MSEGCIYCGTRGDWPMGVCIDCEVKAERKCHKLCDKMACIDPDMKPEDCENSCKNGQEDEELENE